LREAFEKIIDGIARLQVVEEAPRWHHAGRHPDRRAAFTRELVACYVLGMKTDTVEIPTPVLSSVETLDELQDWLTAQNPKLIAELRAARREDRAGKFKPWKPRHLPCHTGYRIQHRSEVYRRF
jgi:hypothetical protein